MTEKYEAVVVGAGPAGLAAAAELAKNGVQTLVLERAKKVGAKNVTGGILYGQTNTQHNLDHLYPDFHKEAPIERPIRKYDMIALSGDKAKRIDLTRLHEHETKWSYSLLRGKFDPWFAEKVHKDARKAGGGVLTDVHVTDPIIENGRVVGVKTNELDDIRADLVIAADGATSELVRKSGLRGWGRPDQWFQGVKVVVKVKDMERRVGVGPGNGGLDNDGAALLYAGDIFGGVRGGGFLYTNKETLSIGTVFHLDSLAEHQIEPHQLLDRLLRHPTVANILGDDYEELEYSAKLIPDGKKQSLKTPYMDGLVAIGDAAGQLQAQGPVIKGMNLGISAGIMAAQAFVEAKAAGDINSAAKRYGAAFNASYLPAALRPTRYSLIGRPGESFIGRAFARAFIASSFGPMLARNEKRIQSLFSSPFWAGAMPDTDLGYSTLPAMVAEHSGDHVDRLAKATTKSLDDRIAALKYDTDIGRPHIVLTDHSVAASGAATHTCPVSSRDSSRGCYSIVEQKSPSGGPAIKVVALDTQPCVECGTCALMAATKWEHPSGGKGVIYEFG
ncbi:MAG: FAD-dependent oxidoreductase [Candidatus Thermoplasmatota archaeon]